MCRVEQYNIQNDIVLYTTMWQVHLGLISPELDLMWRTKTSPKFEFKNKILKTC